MPQVDTPFIIGVIREKEKGLLQEDEYTRLIHAPDAKAAIQMLTDTVYGVSLEQTGSPFEALQAHLNDERVWLKEMLSDERAYTFLDARTRALTATVTLLQEGQIRDSKQVSLLDAKDALVENLMTAAHTPLMKDVATLTVRRIEADMHLRGGVADSTHGELELPDFLSEESVNALRDGNDATLYEREWDVEFMRIIQEHRAEPVGIDAVLAYWFAKELEVKTVRLLLSAKLGGLETRVIEALQRPLYLATI